MRRTATLVLLGALAAAPAADATFPGGNGRIAFSVRGTNLDDSGRKESYRALETVKANSKNDRFARQCIVTGDGVKHDDCTIDYLSPAWAPNGTRLAFDAGKALALVNRNGSGFRLLSAYTANDSEPAWSKSGRRLAFTGKTGSRNDIFVADPSSRVKRRLARRATGAAWSSRDVIAFERGGNIFRIRPSGGGLKRLTSAGGRDPSWSANGRTIVFARRGGIYTMTADGEKLTRIVRRPGCAAPALSPNGRFVVYQRQGVEVARVSDGKRTATLVRNVKNSPDGSSSRAASPDWGPTR